MSGNDDLVTLPFETGPVASVYLDTTSATTNPRELIDLRWKNLRRGLEGSGADAATLDAMEATVVEAHGGGDTLAMVAAGGTVDPIPNGVLMHPETLRRLPQRDHRHVHHASVVDLVGFGAKKFLSRGPRPAEGVGA